MTLGFHIKGRYLGTSAEENILTYDEGNSMKIGEKCIIRSFLINL
jgi:hypothetical protein